MNTPTKRDMDCPESECVYYGKPKHKDCGCLNVPGPPSASSVLKPCPFCGGEAGLGLAPLKPIPAWVSCTECFAEIESATEAEAIAAWNRRRPHIEDVLAEAACRAVACLKEWHKEGDIADDVSAAIMFPTAPDTERSGTPTPPAALVQS